MTRLFYIEVHRHGRLPSGYSLPAVLGCIPELTGKTYPLLYVSHLETDLPHGIVDIYEVVNPTCTPMCEVYYFSIGYGMDTTEHALYVDSLLDYHQQTYGGEAYTQISPYGVVGGIAGGSLDAYTQFFQANVPHTTH